MVSTIHIPFRSSVLSGGQGVKPAASPLHANIAQTPPSPPATGQGLLYSGGLAVWRFGGLNQFRVSVRGYIRHNVAVNG